ncbi:hypothetical protein GALL_540560 [mine drainage metagenome]|uniref:Uncharacterized protein n=1 Tax=mine drainage metagenome TaxID=410659 RepID=A0A1J5NYP9_9ZZZZ
MTMLMHTCDPCEQNPSSLERRGTIGEGAAEASLAMVKRLCVSGLTVLATGCAIAAIVALKAAIFLWVFHYY